MEDHLNSIVPEKMDLYQVLGCLPTATSEQIKVCYRKLALKHHPDKGGDPEMFKNLSKAYQILINSELRNNYDQALPIPDTDLISPLKVFSQCFDQWLSHYPLAEFMFKESCHDIINLLNTYNQNPMMKLLIDSLISDDQHIPISLTKKVFVTLDDLYLGKKYPHHFSITNEDLLLSNDFNIINPEIQIKIPLETSELEIETDLYIINQQQVIYYVQPVKVCLEVITVRHPNFCRINEYDLLIYIDLPIKDLIETKIMVIMYLNHKNLRFKNPHNLNLRQVYQIEGIALPNKTEKKRGNVYILFNLLIHQQQRSSILNTIDQGYIYQLIPVDASYIFRIDDQLAPLPTYPT
jgi:curved DNA-binding protein CbpA